MKNDAMRKPGIKDAVIVALVVTNLATVGLVAARVISHAANPAPIELEAQPELAAQDTAPETQPEAEEIQAEEVLAETEAQDYAPDPALLAKISELEARVRSLSATIQSLSSANARADTLRREEAAAKMIALNMYGRLLNAYALGNGFTNEEHGREQEVDKYIMASKFKIEEDAKRLVRTGFNPYRLTNNRSATARLYFDISLGEESLSESERNMVFSFSSPDRFESYRARRNEIYSKIPANMYDRSRTVDFEKDF